MNASNQVMDGNGCGGYELRFRSLFDDGRGYSFPCDAAGHVVMDLLCERALNNYLYVRVMIGREFHLPQVVVPH